MVKIIGIEGSPRKDGNTEKLVRQVLSGAREAGAGTEFFKLAELNVSHCRGCGTCRATGACVMEDDMDRLVDAIQESDGLVLGSPVYVWQVSGMTKVFMDRLCRLLTPTYESRLNGPKRIAFAYTQGNPDPDLFKPYFDYQEKVFPFLGFTWAGRVLATGTRAREDVLSRGKILEDAGLLGRELAIGGR